jgi:hypothetical protein
MLRGKLCGFAAGNENAVRHRGTQHVRSVRRHIVPRFAAVTSIFGAGCGNDALVLREYRSGLKKHRSYYGVIWCIGSVAE